jgi:hypothetical protein
MALFAILLPKENPRIVAAIKDKFTENNYFEICPTQWIVSGKGPAKKISDTIGISSEGEQTLGSGVVLAFTGYWGRASTDLWEWMKIKIEEGDNG